MRLDRLPFRAFETSLNINCQQVSVSLSELASDLYITYCFRLFLRYHQANIPRVFGIKRLPERVFYTHYALNGFIV